MASRIRTPVLFLLLIVGFGARSAAHHSTAMYDMSKHVTITGKVTEVRWTNPHVVFVVQTDPRSGERATIWVVETTSPGNLVRDGWTRQSVKVGDRIETIVAPLRDGRPAGVIRGDTKLLDTGKVLPGG